jgi:hypothetical protein
MVTVFIDFSVNVYAAMTETQLDSGFFTLESIVDPAVKRKDNISVEHY